MRGALAVVVGEPTRSVGDTAREVEFNMALGRGNGFGDNALYGDDGTAYSG